MVGGWDKSPGPENHYTSEPMTRLQILLVAAVFTAVALGIAMFAVAT